MQDYIKKLQITGGIVNRSIVIAAATGIVEYHNSAILREHGGPIEFGKKWADSILSWKHLVKHKATKAARKVPTDFAEIKLAFLKRVTDCVQKHKIPPQLILNWDQTGAKFVYTCQREDTCMAPRILFTQKNGIRYPKTESLVSSRSPITHL